MNNTAAVRLGQGVGHLPGDVHRLAHPQRPMGDARREDVALDVLHREQVGARPVGEGRGLEAIDVGDVGVIDRGEQPGLALEPREARYT